MPVQIGTRIIDALLFGPRDQHRQVQDFPVLGDVWAQLAARPSQPPDLLIIPTREKSAAEVAAIIETEGEAQNKGGDRSVAYLNDLVVATLALDDVIERVLPATRWWDLIGEHWMERQPSRARLMALIRSDLRALLNPRRSPFKLGSSENQRAARIGLLMGMFRAAATEFKAGTTGQIGRPDQGAGRPDLQLELGDGLEKAVQEFTLERIVGEGAAALMKVQEQYLRFADVDLDGNEWNGVIFQVTLNRSAELALTESVSAIKGDAARLLFSINCSKVAWAVLDSGIDHKHPAFWNRAEVLRRLEASGGQPLSFYPHRIKGIFDFRRVRAILGVKHAQIVDMTAEICGRVWREPAEVTRLLVGIIDDRQHKYPIDWRKVEPLISLHVGDAAAAKRGPGAPQSMPPAPERPSNPHGTHVAGIIGADWWERDATRDWEVRLQGVCPDINLYDFRVLGSSLGDSEFAVSAALQFIRFYNEQGGYPRVHGVNMSLSIHHNVRNYACGRTPVCLEAEALVKSGVIVVAAAGNRGFQQFLLADSTTYEGYAASSITDPGNADSVITVGSTHRAWPHTYGVSFFSSRGPTGDGRLKPDLLAPGEKIVSCIPGGKSDDMDGTSMAAPHVSGAAALIVARHEEFKRQPERVKQLLCEHATDLKRERSFQGHGMVDVLRAMQSL